MAVKTKVAKAIKAHPSKPSRDVHQEVTDQIIRMLEQGVRPWSRSWGGDDNEIAMLRPLRHNDEPYRGINVLILWAAAWEKSYASPFWMTYKQAVEYGGQVRKGEHGTNIVFYTRRVIEEGTADERFVPILRTFNVFNTDQIDGLPEKFHPKQPKQPEPIVAPTGAIERIPHAEAFFDALGFKVKHAGNQAFYSPSQDRIQLPPFEKFHSAHAYYTTRGHESVHATRHKSRLERDFGRERWGDEGYAMEELVAELGAAYLGADLGLCVEPREDHAAYLADWLKVLKDDKKAIFLAATHAEKAVKFLHDLAKPVVIPAAEDEDMEDDVDLMAA
jgi:antirestriction protein ArdC